MAGGGETSGRDPLESRGGNPRREDSRGDRFSVLAPLEDFKSCKVVDKILRSRNDRKNSCKGQLRISMVLN